MTTELTPGQWAVFRSRGVSFSEYEAAQIERVTAKTVYAKTRYNRQFAYIQVIPMPDEASAKLAAERIKSATAEAEDRVRNARLARQEKIDAILFKAREAL